MMEFTGLLKILKPDFLKFYGINIPKLITKMFLFFITSSFLILIVSLYYCQNDLNIFITYLMMVVAMFGTSVNQFYLIKCSDAIWGCMRVVDTGFLSSDFPVKGLLKLEKLKCKMASLITLFLCLLIFIYWVCLPFFQETPYMTIKFNTIEYNYNWTQYILSCL